MNPTSILPAFEDSRVPSAPASHPVPPCAIDEGQGRNNPASAAATRAVLLRAFPWLLLVLWTVLAFNVLGP